jgi:hypothetical protein
MNRDRRLARRRVYRLRTPKGVERTSDPDDTLDLEDVAPWVIATVRQWPRSIEDRVVAVGLGVGLRQVQLARNGTVTRGRRR